MKKMTKNNGISLLILIVTIVVMLILVTTVTITAVSAIESARVTTFATDLNEIEDAVEAYYITNSTFPSVDGFKAISKDDLLNLTRSQVKSKLDAEVSNNNDTSSEFYQIDLSKINVTQTKYGNKSKGESDVFMVAYPSLKVYYVYGLDAENDTYFSITSKISEVNGIEQPSIDDSTTTVMTSGNVKVTKNNGWSNKMGVIIEADMAAGEVLYMSVSNGTNRQITTTVGINRFGFNLLSAIITNSETIKVPSLTFAEANYIEAGTKPLNERYVDILKYKGTEQIGKVRIDLSNFNKTLPTTKVIGITSYENMNTLKLQLATSGSGIKEVRYEYHKKYTEDATIDNYYNAISDFDSTYLLSKGKKAQVGNDLTTVINAPKNVQAIKIAVVDKAGNIYLYSQRIAPNLYIGHSIEDSGKPNLKITAKFTNISEVLTVKMSKSVDGINFTDEVTYSLPLNTLIKQHTFANITTDKIFVKIVASNPSGTIKESRVISVNMKESSYSYNKPIIPTGFTHLEGTWDNGFVIKDANGNEFVWIPVDGTNVKYEKNLNYPKNIDIKLNEISDDKLPAGVLSEQDQIAKYGGFYIARYEAGKEGTTLVSKKRATVWNSIGYAQAKPKAEGMYTSAEVKSGLITGTMWDTTMKWLNNAGINVLDSKKWGNYLDSSSPANVPGFGTLQVTGFSEQWKSKNIYDLAGNTAEFTNELCDLYGVFRGNNFDTSGESSASFRNYDLNNPYDVTVSFRPALYIK